MLDFDEMLFKVGEFGLYQKALFIFQAPFSMFLPFVLFGQLFMTLYPMTIWCDNHFTCTTGTQTPLQRQNFSIPYTSGALNHCFMHKYENAAFIKAVAAYTKSGKCATKVCNYNQEKDDITPYLRNALVKLKVIPQQNTRRYADNYTDSGDLYENPVENVTSKTGKYGRDSKGSRRKGSFRLGHKASHEDRSGESGGISSGRTFPTKASCPAQVNAQMDPRARIIMKEINTDKTNGLFQPLTLTSCKVKWNETQAGVPYETIVTEGYWWCDTEYYLTAAQAVFFLGAIVGGFLIGWIADSYGRVPAFVLANVFGAVGGALSVVTTNVWLFMFFRFITGMAYDNCFTMMYILVLEFCGPSYRTLVANLSIAVFYTLGTLILPWLAVFIGNWRIYGLAISLPMLLGLLAIFFVPESARWLLSKGRTEEATDILRSFAKVNKKTVDEDVFVEFQKEGKILYDEMISKKEHTSLLAALKTPRLRRTFILLLLVWSMMALVYDGHSRNILNLADEQWSVFWMFTIASVTEFPADMLLIFTLDRFGRRWLSFVTLTLSGVASIISAIIPQNMHFISFVMAIVSRFFVNVAFNIGMQFAAELLPTVIRAQGVNVIHIMGYVASIVSPFVASIGHTNPTLSLILLGTFAIIGGFLSLFLAETLGEDLPNSLEEAELFGINQSFWNCPICAKGIEEAIIVPAEEREDADVILALMQRRKSRASIGRGRLSQFWVDVDSTSGSTFSETATSRSMMGEPASSTSSMLDD